MSIRLAVHSSNNLFSFFKIAKAVVDKFKPKLTIPSCVVELEWTGGEQVPPQQLRHKVTLKGTKSPMYFHIRHNPQAVGGCALLENVRIPVLV